MAKMYLKKKILQNNFIFTYAFHKKWLYKIQLVAENSPLYSFNQKQGQKGRITSFLMVYYH